MQGTPPKGQPKQDASYHRWHQVIYLGDVATPTAYLKLLKIILNSVLSRNGAKFACFDVKNDLATLMDRSEYAKINISDIQSEFIEEYNLQAFAHNGWVHF